jgi:hypothetical protein
LAAASEPYAGSGQARPRIVPLHNCLFCSGLTHALDDSIRLPHGAFTIDHHLGSSILCTSPRHDNILSALAGFSYWWDFSIPIAKLHSLAPKRWRGNIDCCSLFALMRNRLAAYAISKSGVQLAELTDIGSCVPNSSCTPHVGVHDGSILFRNGYVILLYEWWMNCRAQESWKRAQCTQRKIVRSNRQAMFQSCDI